MIKIAALDDEYHVLERFERIANRFEELSLRGVFTEAEELLCFLKKETLDAVFLDIEMPETDGLALSAQIQDLAPNIDIIFVTAFSQYAAEAFELNALDYILKPVSQERLAKTVDRLRKHHQPAAKPQKPRIQCFGEFEVFVDGEIMHWKNSKAKEVLAYLVHKRGIPQSWQKIADAVWPEFDLEKAHANFHTTTYLLRKTLAEKGISDILESKRGSYRVFPDAMDCDAYRFEDLAKQILSGAPHSLPQVELLYRGTYFEETGYEWAHPRAAEMEALLAKLKARAGENNAP